MTEPTTDDLGVRQALATDLTEHARRLRECARGPARGYDATLTDFVRLLPDTAGVPAGAAAE
jgi:hypothetical protein